MSHADDFASGGPLLGGVERVDGTYLNSLSASSISELMTCPERFRLSRLHRIKRRARAPLVLGSAFHEARRINYEQKMFSRVDLSVDEVLDAYMAAYDRAAENEDIDWRDDDPQATRTLGAEMVKKYHQQLSPSVQPIAVEEYFERPVADVPVPLVGRIDVLDEEPKIIDTKTDKQGATQPRAEWRVQALVYMSVFPKYSFAWHVQSKAGTLRCYGPDKHPRLLLRNTPGRQRAALLMVQEAWGTLTDHYKRYGLDHPWPGTALTNPYACFQCQHRAKCVWWP